MNFFYLFITFISIWINNYLEGNLDYKDKLRYNFAKN